MTNEITAAALADEFIQYTGRSLFLTGKAGTGKTTFLKKIKDHLNKKMIIAAPTGVAAINAGGVTLHSLFQLPFKPFIPTDRTSNESNLNCVYRDELIESIHFSKEKISLLTALELLVIDEISMVRADVLDAIDIILKHVRGEQNKPFGGVQILFIGDLLQLSPIAKNDDWQILNQFYASPFFFCSKVIAPTPLIVIELKHIYRQSDPRFISLLNNIRNNEINNDDILVLQKCYHPSLATTIPDGYITLTTHNHQAETINLQKLDELPGENHLSEAVISGNFDQKIFPVDKTITLKVGTQVMLIKNDKPDLRRFYNGKIGTISKIVGDDIWIGFLGENEFLLEKESWKNVEYRYDINEGKIKEEVIGEFKQFPIRLAWAITIHKSQGLTFERAIVDIGDSFAAGQVYVALSRVKSLEGLLLRSEINMSSITSNQEVIHFLNTATKSDLFLDALLKKEKANFLLEKIVAFFKLNPILQILAKHQSNHDKWKLDKTSSALKWEEEFSLLLNSYQETVLTFIRHLEILFILPDNYMQFQSRIKDAVIYFHGEIEKNILPFFYENVRKAKVGKYPKAYLTSLELFDKNLKDKITDLNNATNISNALTDMEGKFILEKINELCSATNKGESEKSQAANKTSSVNLAIVSLYKSGKTISEIANKRKLANNTVETHLLSAVQTGNLSIYELMPLEKIYTIANELNGNSLNINIVKSNLGEQYSFFHIRSVLNHLTYLKESGQ